MMKTNVRKVVMFYMVNRYNKSELKTTHRQAVQSVLAPKRDMPAEHPVVSPVLSANTLQSIPAQAAASYREDGLDGNHAMPLQPSTSRG